MTCGVKPFILPRPTKEKHEDVNCIYYTYIYKSMNGVKIAKPDKESTLLKTYWYETSESNKRLDLTMWLQD